MKKFLSVVSLLMALMMLCTSALANEQKYDEPVTVHFVRSTETRSTRTTSRSILTRP